MLGLPPFLTTKEVFSFEDQNNFSGNLGPPRILLPSPILTPWKPMNETPHTQQSYFYPLFLLPPFFTLPGDEEEKEEAEKMRRKEKRRRRGREKGMRRKRRGGEGGEKGMRRKRRRRMFSMSNHSGGSPPRGKGQEMKAGYTGPRCCCSTS